MRVRIFPLLNCCAIKSLRAGSIVYHVYRDDIDKPDLSLMLTAVTNREGDIFLTEDYAFKHYRLRLADRLFGCRIDRYHGLTGGAGELVNTIVANTIHVPSPRLISSSINLLTGQLLIAIERLHGCITLAEALGADRNAGEYLNGAFSLLTKALGCGLYHVDPNASNIMLDREQNRWYLIDFEQALPLGAAPEIALSLQAASLFDWRIQPQMKKADYRDLFCNYLSSTFGTAKFSESLSLFDEYTQSRPNRAARRRRLQIAAAGQPDIRPFLLRAQAATA